MRLIDADKRIEELESLRLPKGSEYQEMRDFAVLSLKDADTVDIDMVKGDKKMPTSIIITLIICVTIVAITFLSKK